MPNQGGERSSGDMPGDGKLFNDLLEQLAQHHHEEVMYLRKDLENCRSLLAQSEGKHSPKGEAARDEGKHSLRSVAVVKDPSPPTSPLPYQPGQVPDGFMPLPPGTPVKIKEEHQALEGTEVKDTTESMQGFELKSQWTTQPVASSTWGHELDRLMVTSQAHKLLDTGGPEEEDSQTLKTEGGARQSIQSVFQQQQSVSSKLSTISQALLINPSCQGRVCWDVAGMFLICYDMLAIPITISFEPEEHGFTTFMGWTTLLFWTCDVFGSLFTGYYENGKLVMKQSKIIKQYLKGWFWIDMIVVGPDWVMKFMGSMSNVAGLGRILRTARIMRILRMLRLMKLKKLLALVYDLIDSEYMWIVVSLIRLLAMLLVMNHMVACAWFLVGRLSKGSYAKNWLQDSGMTPVWDEDLGWRYLTSLHWSITQFTPASMDISATNSMERLFSIAILFWALVCLSSVIGNVSASMTALRNMSSDEMQKFWMLRRYFKQKQISRDLSERIIKYLEYECTAKKDVVPNTKVALLKEVSENLRLELANEMNGPILTCHPFFKYISTEIPAMMFRLCNIVKATMYAADDVAFLAGDEGAAMYFFKQGRFEYKLVDGHALDTPLGPKTWASEAVLWTVWRHRGSLTALEPSEVTEIRPQPFLEVFRMHPRPWNLGRQYGAQFVEYMNCINRTALTDVIFDNDIFTKLVVEHLSDPYSPQALEKGRSRADCDKVAKDESKQAWA
jgi:hypothetical protein